MVSNVSAHRAFATVRYAKTHEWVRDENGSYVMGISDFAQSQLGEVVYCDLPEEGAKLKGKDTICTLESVKAVGEVNAKLHDEPALVNNAPEEDGWLLKFKVTGDMPELMDKSAYAQHVEAESK